MTGTRCILPEILKTIEMLCARRSPGTYHVVLNSVLTGEAIRGFMKNNARKLKRFLQWCMAVKADDFKFLPGGRIMHGAGRTEAKRRPTLSNCYVIPIEEDSLEGIYRCLVESAMVYRTGGGVGTDLSILRPEGAPVDAPLPLRRSGTRQLRSTR